MRKLISITLAAAAFGALALPAAARTNFDVHVNIGPPALRYEPVPVARPGHAWIPGYWDWRVHRHVWVPGHYVRHRPGYVYASPRWVHGPGGWHLHRGGWRHRDWDGDGVPNRWDHRPRNPWRY